MRIATSSWKRSSAQDSVRHQESVDPFHRLVRDVIAYLRLIHQPSDDVSCARVLAMPAWGLDASDLVRLAERKAKSKGASLWDTLQSARSEPPFSEGGRHIGELVELVSELRMKAHRLTAAEF